MTRLQSVRLITLALAMASVPVAGCSHPKSECSNDGQCSAGKSCRLVSEISPSGSGGVRQQTLKAPVSTTKIPPEEQMTVTITRESLRVNDEKVADVPVDASQKRGGESGLEIIPLRGALSEEVELKRREMKLLAQEYKPTIQIVADRTTSARLMTEVMYTADQTGVKSYQFAVRRSGGDGVWAELSN